jgi:hypothetical protein
MFAIFGGVYILCYAVGCSWNYRLMFLLPTLPFAIESIRKSRHALLWSVYIFLVIFAENAVRFRPRFQVISEDIATFAIAIIVLTVLTELVRRNRIASSGYCASTNPSQAA